MTCMAAKLFEPNIQCLYYLYLYLCIYLCPCRTPHLDHVWLRCFKCGYVLSLGVPSVAFWAAPRVNFLDKIPKDVSRCFKSWSVDILYCKLQCYYIIVRLCTPHLRSLLPVPSHFRKRVIEFVTRKRFLQSPAPDL